MTMVWYGMMELWLEFVCKQRFRTRVVPSDISGVQIHEKHQALCHFWVRLSVHSPVTPSQDRGNRTKKLLTSLRRHADIIMRSHSPPGKIRTTDSIHHHAHSAESAEYGRTYRALYLFLWSEGIAEAEVAGRKTFVIVAKRTTGLRIGERF